MKLLSSRKQEKVEKGLNPGGGHKTELVFVDDLTSVKTRERYILTVNLRIFESTKNFFLEISHVVLDSYPAECRVISDL